MSTETSPDSKLLVNEIYGPIFQGEGRQVGRIGSFIRLGACNLHCSFCDTPYTWAYDERHRLMHRDGVAFDPQVENERLSWQECYDRLVTITPALSLIIISGGEPLLQAALLVPLVVALQHLGYDIAYETAGTISPKLLPFPAQWTVSPKLQSSGNELSKRFRPAVLKEFVAWDADFKFVVTDTSDIPEIQRIQNACDIPSSHMWLMPEGVDADTLLKSAPDVEKHALRRGWNFTLRQHVLLHGNERGV